MPERGLQRLQAIELVGELVALPAVRLVGHVFLGVLDHASELGDVELVHRHGEVGELAGMIKDTEEDVADEKDGWKRDKLAHKLDRLKALQAALGH